MSKPKAIQPLARGKKVNWLLYSDPGIGKTKLIGTTPGKCLILRPPTDHTDSILDPGPGMEEWVLRDWAEAWESLDYVRQEGDQWDWIWLDSASLFQDTGLDDIWELVISEKPSRQRYGLDKQEYGINHWRLGQFVRHIVGADMVNFGMTAHVMMLPISLDPDADEKLMPAIHGKTGGAAGGMSIKMCGYMNLVTYLGMTAKGRRILYSQPTERYYAKDQYNALEGGKLLNPSVPKVIELIEKNRPKAGASKRRGGGTRRRTTNTKGR